MSFTKLSPDGRGGFNVFENWSTGDETFSKLLPLLIAIPVILLFCLFLPVIMWIIAPLESNKSNRQNNYVSIISSIVFLLDYMIGGPLWSIFTHTGNVPALEFFGALHVGFLVISLLFAYVMKNNISLPFVLFYGGIIAFLVLGNTKLHGISDKIKSDTPAFFLEDYHNEQMLESPLPNNNNNDYNNNNNEYNYSGPTTDGC